MSEPLIQFSHLFHSFGSNFLFEDISFSIKQGEVFALIGENGAGKSTLLKLLNSSILPDRGEINSSKHLTIGYLPQEVEVEDPNLTVRSYIEGKVTELEEKMVLSLESSDLKQWAELHEQYEQLGGYKKIPLEKVLKGLKLEIDLLQYPIKRLSSGQKVRVALAKALVDNPDLLLLDEPTNHLDEERIKWLENALKSRLGATIIISHNRQFINATCNRIIEIERGQLQCFGGNYDFYLKEKKRLLAEQIKAYEEQELERKELKEQINALSFAKAKATAPKDRNLMPYDHKGGKFQKSEQRKIDQLKLRLEKIETNRLQHPKPKSITGLRFEVTALASNVAIEFKEISKSFADKPLFSNLNKVLCKGDRIVLKGPNGAGKTTLLKCLSGQIPVDKGQIRLASSAKISFLEQEITNIDQTPLEYFESRFQLNEEGLRRKLHMAALGGAELLESSFSTLSLGQKKRLMLLSMILDKPNVLLLDEPTNHLDLLTLEALEEALLDFQGAILAVSHDETFIEKIATDVWHMI